MTLDEMEAHRVKAWQEMWYWEGMIFREKLKSKALTPEETRRISGLIGNKVKKEKICTASVENV